MNATAASNTTLLPPVNLTQTVKLFTVLFNATALTNTTTRQSIPYNVSSTLSTVHVHIAHESETCQSFEYDFHKNIPISIVCGLCFLFGVIIVFVGMLLCYLANILCRSFYVCSCHFGILPFKFTSFRSYSMNTLYHNVSLCNFTFL